MSWEDDVSLMSSAGGGSYIDPRTGRKYALMDYKYRGKRKRLWGGRRKHTGTDVIDITGAEDDYEQYSDAAAGTYYRGKYGNRAYRGPGKSLSQGTYKRRSLGGAAFGGGSAYGKSGMTSAQKQFTDYLKNTANWWEKERLSGERGQERKMMLESQAKGLELMRAEAAEGRGWGRTQAAK